METDLGPVLGSRELGNGLDGRDWVCAGSWSHGGLEITHTGSLLPTHSSLSEHQFTGMSRRQPHPCSGQRNKLSTGVLHVAVSTPGDRPLHTCDPLLLPITNRSHLSISPLLSTKLYLFSVTHIWACRFLDFKSVGFRFWEKRLCWNQDST